MGHLCVWFANRLWFGSVSSRWTWPFAYDCIFWHTAALWCALVSFGSWEALLGGCTAQFCLRRAADTALLSAPLRGLREEGGWALADWTHNHWCSSVLWTPHWSLRGQLAARETLGSTSSSGATGTGVVQWATECNACARGLWKIPENTRDNSRNSVFISELERIAHSVHYPVLAEPTSEKDICKVRQIANLPFRRFFLLLAVSLVCELR